MVISFEEGCSQAGEDPKDNKGKYQKKKKKALD